MIARASLASLVLLAAAAPVMAQQSGPSAASSGSSDIQEWQVPWGASTRPRDPFVDTQGKVIVFTTTKEHAELKRDQIHAFGKDADSEAPAQGNDALADRLAIATTIHQSHEFAVDLDLVEFERAQGREA